MKKSNLVAGRARTPSGTVTTTSDIALAGRGWKYIAANNGTDVAGSLPDHSFCQN
jgi:hypothetical protein